MISMAALKHFRIAAILIWLGIAGEPLLGQEQNARPPQRPGGNANPGGASPSANPNAPNPNTGGRSPMGQGQNGRSAQRPGGNPVPGSANANANPNAAASTIPSGQPRVAATANMSSQPRVAMSNEPASMKLRFENQELVGEIRNTPLQQVLQEIAAWTGVVFEIPTPEDPAVSIAFFHVPVSEAVQRLTAANNSITYYEKDENGRDQVRFVRIFTRAPRPDAPTLHYIGTGAITKRPEDLVDSPEQAISVLTGSANLASRQKAIEVLVNTKTANAIQALTLALKDPSSEIKVSAIEGLTTLGAHDALPQILLVLKDSDPGVRKSAIQAIGLMGEAIHIKELRPLLRDRDSGVTAAAEIAIQRLSVRSP
jgi:hypothetical protein